MKTSSNMLWPSLFVPSRFAICHLSGGVASWLAAKRALAKYGRENTILLFADTRAEEKSTYTFLSQCIQDLSPVREVHLLSDGRTPWQVFRDERFLGNSRIDPCSRILKRELMNKWVRDRFHSGNCVQIFGYDWTEGHRLRKLQSRFSPWPVEAPLLEEPYLEKCDMLKLARDNGMTIPKLYELGFSHNNCGGECVKAGQAHYARLYQVLPAAYAHAEKKESELIQLLGNVSILKDRRGGISRPMPLSEFRSRIESGDFDKFDYGACSCFTGSMED